jgi:mono/diheme cytochrome c family protein
VRRGRRLGGHPGWLPSGHARRAALRGLRGQPVVRRRPRVAQPAGGHDDHLYTGKIDGIPAQTFPFAIGAAELERGRDRYTIYCTPCHGQLGDGKGMVVQRGLRQAATYHQERLQRAQPGYFFDVITNGFGAMQGYAEQIPPRDRWMIAAYVRALQLSQNAAVDDVPAADRARLDQPAAPAGAPPAKH